ncbi:PREDICTED: mediator of DNA damage checkpoint protein 1 isoform X4 [Nicrophorus vespilloides]|uniref:Mediator of DNA damage checkpoint protein 1 isoform X4 n=1 Tax=Nicrophorus vespilloides TaxID=110193 RepID=A0ABM1MPG9_NICVS|nr:PREDICTED: mediator of DNA damage checkpoint protein 1 isoform X4 [Nicrophorus vespilloides]
MKPLSILGAALLLLTTSGTGFGQRKISRSQPVTTEVKTGVNFDCPEDFGYYPHPTDCTQYYVCVFGGALLESCTGGLMYSHELQTCDWPRNVGCDAVGEITVTATASPSTSGRSSEVTRSRYTPPPPPPQPAAVVTSRGQPRQYHHQEIIKQQQQLYEDADEVLPPAEEIESDRQQRVYRGQPSTVGQVQRDRDGLRHTNAIPSYSSRGDKIGVISFGTQQQSQPIQQYRVEVTSVGPSQQPSIATATTRALYNGSQHYDPAHYDPYYSLYEDDVELYRDVDYSQHYNNNNNNNNHNHGHQSFRGTPAPAAQPSPTPEEPKRGNAAYINSYTTQDVYQQPSVPDYNEDNSYNSQVDEQTSYRQSSRQPTRGKVKFPAQSKQEKKESTTHRTTTTTAGTTTSTAKPTTTTTTARTTTTKTTTTTTTTTTTERPVSSTLIEAQSTEKFKHFVEPSSYQRFRNTVEVPHPHQLLVDPEDVAKPEPDQPPTFKPKPPTIPKLTSDAITKTTADSVPRNTSLPARVSRVNAAIKSIIGFGGTRRQNPKCNENQTTNVKCNDLKQRTSNRGRGSAHYSSSNAGSSSSSSSSTGETVNRGTPPTRSRPTLKPSTSIVSKAVEFVDIYRFPPRRPETIYPQPQPDKTAAKCRKDVCLLPDCSCGGKEIPGEMSVEQLPQIVLLTFDDSVNDLNKGLYSDLFEKGRVNPNGCPLSATFYVSHEWTDYSQVQNLYSDGHEMASHTVSHSFGEQFSQKKWTREIAGQREILSAYGGVKLEDVRGMRAPFLSVGGNKMFKMLYDSNFTYDSSMPIYENKPPSWPYTLDYKLFHDCMIPPCPTRSYPGVWEVPMVMWQDLNGGRCSMGDACSNPADSDGVFKMIMKNFDRHYTTNRAPFGLFYHAAWFTQPHHKEGFIKFMDTVNKMKDVFFVTNWQAIQWVRDPTPMSRINQFQPFQCNYSDRPKRCNNPKVCNLWHKSGVRYMRTCQPCPDIYPWTGNSGIRSSRIDNDIED